MQKTYRSTSALNVGVTFRNGGHKRIKFNPYSYGGSIYVTTNEEEMWALEHNSCFGGMFYIDSVIGDDEDAGKDSQQSQTDVTERKGEESQRSGGDDRQTETVGTNGQADTVGIKDVEVNDYDDAKDYLVENHGYNRSQLRSKVSINDAAEKCGIKFVGI